MLYINDLAYQLTCPLEQYTDCTMLSKNEFQVNEDKTTILTLGTKRRLQLQNNGIDVYMDGLKLKESGNPSKTLLGCEIQSNLKWTQQIISLKAKLKKRVSGVYNLRNTLPPRTLKVICKGWFQSVLAYMLTSLWWLLNWRN